MSNQPEQDGLRLQKELRDGLTQLINLNRLLTIPILPFQRACQQEFGQVPILQFHFTTVHPCDSESVHDIEQDVAILFCKLITSLRDVISIVVVLVKFLFVGEADYELHHLLPLTLSLQSLKLLLRCLNIRKSPHKNGKRQEPLLMHQLLQPFSFLRLQNCHNVNTLRLIKSVG